MAAYSPNDFLSMLLLGGGGKAGLARFAGPAGWTLAGGGLLASLLQASRERQRYTRQQQQIRSLLDPENIYQRGVTDFNRTLEGPGFQAARRFVFDAGQSLEQRIQSGAARAGLNRSGIGLAAMGGARSSIGRNLSSLYSGAWSDALNRAQEGAYSQASILSGLPRQNDWGQLSGVGLNALLAYLLKRGGVQWQSS